MCTFLDIPLSWRPLCLTLFIHSQQNDRLSLYSGFDIFRIPYNQKFICVYSIVFTLAKSNIDKNWSMAPIAVSYVWIWYQMKKELTLIQFCISHWRREFWDCQPSLSETPISMDFNSESKFLDLLGKITTFSFEHLRFW